MLTTQGNTSFTVKKSSEGYYTLFSGAHFLGISNEGKVLIYKADTGNETRFYFN
jgi:hypothetical protein